MEQQKENIAPIVNDNPCESGRGYSLCLNIHGQHFWMLSTMFTLSHIILSDISGNLSVFFFTKSFYTSILSQK